LLQQAPDVAVNRFRLALSLNPDASPDIRAAITEDVRQVDAQVASFPEPTRYDQPPGWHVEEPQAPVDRVFGVCQQGS
jgi:hypothetical protein